ncbi:hypothetical protein [Microbispora bryophytorum]|uniref:hypothetical protein n=1 Tax=Microbispora bryophytorum TaxID=1460882 RepID=UPI001CC298E8|nr:hypothetical protein [Microbispora camponoti]
MFETPTIVLVHGAFADGASWAPVTLRLLDQGRALRLKRPGLRKVIEIDAPHLVMQTHPAEVATFITDAIAELG